MWTRRLNLNGLGVSTHYLCSTGRVLGPQIRPVKRAVSRKMIWEHGKDGKEQGHERCKVGCQHGLRIINKSMGVSMHSLESKRSKLKLAAPYPQLVTSGMFRKAPTCPLDLVLLWQKLHVNKFSFRAKIRICLLNALQLLEALLPQTFTKFWKK